MNIEEARSKLISFIDFYNKKPKEENRKFKMLQVDNIDIKAIETLLTAYEKEKGENVKLRLQDIPLIEGELKAYKDRVNELKQELEKEKEKNKKTRDMIEYYLIDNTSLNDFEKRNKELKKLEKILEE